MLLSPDQLSLFWRLWSQACRVRGWTAKPEQESERRALLARCGFKSLKLVTKVEGFTQVKNEIIVLMGTSVKAGMETNDPSLNKARNYRHVIMTQIVPCLGIYEENPEQYMASVMEDKNRWWKLDRPTCGMALEDLDAPKLKQLMMTLNARLHSKRRASHHTIHFMKISAGVPCDCAECSRPRVIMTTAPVLTYTTEGDPDWNV